MVESMEDLVDSIQNVRFANENFEGRHFVPEAALSKIISEGAVKLCLKDLGIPVHEIRDLTDSILRGARKCFAILLLVRHGEAIPGFFRHDSLQRSHPDDRLPYTSETLQRIFDGKVSKLDIMNFLEKQWEFIIPIMYEQTIFRKLDTEVILPFLREEPVGRGSMGTAWKIELHPQCHGLPIGSNQVVRKQIECRQSDDESIFQKELENLSLLTYLKHPNIVQLYCSYIYRRRYNLIFAVADSGSLADYLNREPETKGLRGPQLLLALTGLADAIHAMHNFISEAFDLSLSGCHHDLAPRNILVHGESLLLADFGLSTFRNAEDDSLTTFKEVRGSYVAPECQTFRDGHVQTEKIGRASDIWSFGCILAEVLTHMVLGKGGVQQFRDKRRVEVTPDIEWFRFHKGPDTPNPEVLSWLDMLQENGEPYRVRMVQLIRMMLTMDPKARPDSRQVMMALRGISILYIANSVSLVSDSVRKTHQSIDLVLAIMRFDSWLFAFNRLLDDITRTTSRKVDFDFHKIGIALRETHRIFEGNGQGLSGAQSSLLRYQDARLIEALPPSFRSIAKDHLVKQILSSEMDQLGRLSEAISNVNDEDIGTLAAVKHLTNLAETGRLTEQPDLILDLKKITLKGDIDFHILALLESTSERALVEWLRYKGAWADDATGAELRQRLTSVAGLLSAESTARIPGTLRCKGFFHDPSRRSFGVVYTIPPFVTPVSLHTLLTQSASRPLLEFRFRLAYDICNCIYTFHKVGWLHRNIHSKNVMFFPQEGVEKVKWARDPRILGFSASRENTFQSFTQGPDDDSQLRKYQHPEYLADRKRYREEFDYYSIGMLLLEIGLWSTLSKVTESSRFKGLTEEEFRREVIATRTPQLGIAMGTRYMEATRTCLEGNFVRGSERSVDGAVASYTLFRELVMDMIKLIE